jgi:hypothetical protein
MLGSMSRFRETSYDMNPTTYVLHKHVAVCHARTHGGNVAKNTKMEGTAAQNRFSRMFAGPEGEHASNLVSR